MRNAAGEWSTGALNEPDRFTPSRSVVIPVKTAGAHTSLEMHLFSRPFIQAREPERERIITFTLLNEKQAKSQRPRDDECFFQCGFEVSEAEGNSCFLEYPERIGVARDEEEESLRLLFAHRKTFAVGHGCAANWPDDLHDAYRVVSYHVFSALANPSPKPAQ